jgi:formylglycine-generating enzyme required for sulfatase activity
MKLVYIPPGDFMMGTPSNVYVPFGRISSVKNPIYGDELPQHPVKITKGFFMGQTEVTQAQWQAVMSNNPSEFKGDNFPVENVSWYDAIEFCRKLSQKEGRTYRLPTEAEWEYACRAGTITTFFFGDNLNDLGIYAWHYDNTDYTDNGWMRPVMLKKPNPWGLYDLYGGVYEWCSDWYGKYPGTIVVDPTGPKIGNDKVSRGTSTGFTPISRATSAMRWHSKSGGNRYHGLRVVMEAD